MKRHFKVIIIGDPMVGKTTLRLRYIGEGFRKEYITTLGVDIAKTTYKDYAIQIWDLSGQHSFRDIIQAMYLGAHGVIIVFDITKRDSMMNIPNWINAFQTLNRETIPFVVIGNKIDLQEPNDFSVKSAETEEFVKSLSIKYNISISCIETSALTGENITPAFEGLIERIITMTTKDL
ncbi:MAG: Rab family GTPase [Candidatus Kariarchaeaceae archaeon]